MQNMIVRNQKTPSTFDVISASFNVETDSWENPSVLHSGITYEQAVEIVEQSQLEENNV